VHFGPLAADIGSLVWGTPANFNGFHVSASLLERHRSMEANQTLHDVWPSPGLVHYIYIFRGSCPVTKFCKVQNSLCVLRSLAFSYIGSVTAWHLSSGCQPNFAALSRGRHLYLAGRPSRWALAHILVVILLCSFDRFVSDIAIFVLKRDVKLQLTNSFDRSNINYSLGHWLHTLLQCLGWLSLPPFVESKMNISFRAE